MKKIYFLFLLSGFCQIALAQNNKNKESRSYSMAFNIREKGRTCGGSGRACSQSLKSAFHSNETYAAIGELWIDEYGRVMIELQKNSLNDDLQNDIYADGLLSLPKGWKIPDYILVEKGLIGVTEQIPPGDYLAIEKERTVLIVLGKLH